MRGEEIDPWTVRLRCLAIELSVVWQFVRFQSTTILRTIFIWLFIYLIFFADISLYDILFSKKHLYRTVVLRTICYLNGSLDRGLLLSATPAPVLSAYANPDQAGCVDTCRCTIKWCLFVSCSLISWKEKYWKNIVLHLSHVLRSYVALTFDWTPVILQTT